VTFVRVGRANDELMIHASRYSESLAKPLAARVGGADRLLGHGDRLRKNIEG
jgi:hypothetical protein